MRDSRADLLVGAALLGLSLAAGILIGLAIGEVIGSG